MPAEATLASQNPWGNAGTWSAPGAATSGGQNQYMTYPALPNFNPVGGGSSYGPVAGGGPGWKAGQFWGGPGGRIDLGGNMFTAPTFDPQFTSSYYGMLGKTMPQAGGLQDQLLSFLSGGKSQIPGAPQLAGMATTGDPISALPEWQAMLEAQKRNISENQANLKEQFGFAGDLQSSPFGTAMTDYMTQTTRDQNALLAQLEQQAMEQAMQRQLTAGMGLQQEAGAESQFLNQLMSQGALATPQLFEKPKTSGLGGILGGIGSMLGGLGSIATGGGLGAIFGGLKGLFGGGGAGANTGIPDLPAGYTPPEAISNLGIGGGPLSGLFGGGGFGGGGGFTPDFAGI